LPSQEARAVLAGHTVSGHPVSEARELLNYRAGTAWIIEQTTPARFFETPKQGACFFPTGEPGLKFYRARRRQITRAELDIDCGFRDDVAARSDIEASDVARP
jgi:hypothetical protein